MFKRSKKALVIVAAMIMACFSYGCDKKESDKGAEATSSASEEATVSATEETGTTTEAAGTTTEVAESGTEGSIKVGYYEGEDKYVNDSFGVTAVLPSGWKFQTSEEISSATGVEVSEIEAVWNGEKSVYDYDVTYLFIAYNTNGTNVIVNYCSPAHYGAPADLSAKEYLESAAVNYPGSEVTVESLNGKTYDCLKLQAGDQYTQEMYCVDKDGIILMITFTVMNGETDDYHAIIQ